MSNRTDPTYEYVKGEGWVPTFEEFVPSMFGWVNVMSKKEHDTLVIYIEKNCYERERAWKSVTLLGNDSNTWDLELLRSTHKNGYCNPQPLGGGCRECDTTFTSKIYALKTRWLEAKNHQDRIDAFIRYWS
jgi:hypothetical protein